MKRDVAVLTTLFTVSGVMHFVRPEPFERIVPKPLPVKRELVYASGAAELAAAALMAVPRTRPLGGRLSAVVLAAVFPANVQMALDVVGSPKAAPWFKAATVARLPLQLPMLRVARSAARS